MPELLSFTDVTNLKGNTEHLATVRIEISLTESESGEEIKIYGIGSGQDAGDKAVMKAQTVAVKYAYMLSLCIATGDDQEADASTDENTAVQANNASANVPKAKSAAAKPVVQISKSSKPAVAICAGKIFT